MFHGGTWSCRLLSIFGKAWGEGEKEEGRKREREGEERKEEKEGREEEKEGITSQNRKTNVLETN